MEPGKTPPPEDPQPPPPKEHQRQVAAALNLLQRLPPQDLQTNLDAFNQIAPHLEQTLEPYVSRPLKIQRDPEYFVISGYNCDGGTHRSPWSNKYIPPPEGDADEERLFRPSERLRRLEETFNEVFDAYKTSYYEGGVSSVYLWDLDEGFAGAFLIRKELSETPKGEKGVWDSIHILEVRESPNSNFAEYKLSTSVLLHMQVGDKKKDGETEVSGLLSRQAESRWDRRKKGGEDAHVMHVGRMIEEMEISIRQNLDSLYMAKQREVLDIVHKLDTAEPCRLPPVQGVVPAAQREGDVLHQG